MNIQLRITEVMRLAGHSKYDTTLKYYLAVKDDLVDKARKAIKHRVSKDSPSISEIQPVFADVCLVLLPVPLKAHGSSITVGFTRAAKRSGAASGASRC